MTLEAFIALVFVVLLVAFLVLFFVSMFADGEDGFVSTGFCPGW